MSYLAPFPSCCDVLVELLLLTGSMLLHCLKKVPTFTLSVTFSNVNRFSKLLHCWKAYEICCKTHMTLSTAMALNGLLCADVPLRTYTLTIHRTLGMLLQYLGKLKMEIFCRYSAHMKENANKLHFIASTLVNHPQISIFSLFKIASFSLY